MQCKNSVECWGLNEDLSLGESEKEQAWDSEKMIKNIRELEAVHDVKLAGDYMGLIMVAWEASLNNAIRDMSTDYQRNAVYTPLFVICAMANTSNDGWDCPENYTYEER